MIDQQTIGRILDAADIVEVVSDFVSLKKRGVNYIGHCPFHNEKTPSFTVSPSKGICKCFGCGAGGNAVNFIMELENLSYPEALKYLARKYNIPIEEKELSKEEKDEKSKLESLRIITEFAGKYFNDTLLNNDEGTTIGLSYLQERGINRNTINKFQLGYCPNTGDAFTQQALKNGYNKALLVELGLTKTGQYSDFDFFKGRVIFPIHNLAGHVIAFGGRTLKATKDTAKYFNSPESPLYHKSDVLYGIYQAKKAITQENKCYLVEGYTDVTSLFQSGIENAVASSGTALTTGQIRLIKRFTQNITIIYDGDAAGIKAALKGIDLVLEQTMNVRVVLLPDGEDPDSFSKTNSHEAFRKYIEEQEKDFIHFKAELLLHEAKDDPVKRAEATRSIVESISKIPDTFIRGEFTRSTARLLKIKEEVLNQEIRQRVFNQIEKINKTQLSPVPPDNQEIRKQTQDFVDFDKAYFHEIESSLLKYLIKYPNNNLTVESDFNEVKSITCAQYLFDELMIDEINFANEIYNEMFHLAFEHFHKGNKLSIDFFINHEKPYISKAATDIIVSKYELSELFVKQNIEIIKEEDRLKTLLPNNIIIYKSRSLNKAAKEIELKLSELNDNDHWEEIIQLTSKLARIKNALKEVSLLIKRIIP
ncbi:MAG: DNA primase [Bacteroidales bacterium]|nr:DNA primase [Bacteroidales bacterium]